MVTLGEAAMHDTVPLPCRDAEEAVRRRDGVEFLGSRLRCVDPVPVRGTGPTHGVGAE